MQSKGTTLNSWKEIAAYFGCGVRTAQRWEAKLGLPVHRIGPSPRAPVYAFNQELDDWLKRVDADRSKDSVTKIFLVATTKGRA